MTNLLVWRQNQPCVTVRFTKTNINDIIIFPRVLLWWVGRWCQYKGSGVVGIARCMYWIKTQGSV
jgi:hypothetical protein